MFKLFAPLIVGLLCAHQLSAQQSMYRACALPPQPEAPPQVWAGGTVYYEFLSVPPTEQLLMRQAMNEWEFCGAGVRFVERTPGIADYVQIQVDSANWSELVGRKGGMQTLHILDWYDHGLLLHELGHVLGLWHEHSHWNRAQYVTVQIANICDTCCQNSCPSSTPTCMCNFKIVEQSDWLTPASLYDFESVMHYHQYEFSSSPGLITIQTQPAYQSYQSTMGQVNQLSALDIQDITTIYPPPCGSLSISGPSSLVLSNCGTTSGAYMVTSSSGSLVGAQPVSFTLTAPNVQGWSATLHLPDGVATTLFFSTTNAPGGTHNATLTWSGQCNGQQVSVQKGIQLQLIAGCHAAASTSVASVGISGAQSNGDSNSAALSADGSRVAFVSWASNLVSNDGVHNYDVFVRDMQSGLTKRASQSTAGVGNNGSNRAPDISADGRFVVYYSDSSTLVAGDSNAKRDVFVFDWNSNSTTRVSVAASGAQGNGHSEDAAISGDGRFVAFYSSATNLTAGGSSSSNVFLRDRLIATTTQVSLGVGGAQPNSICIDPAISDDGRYVAFRSRATNLTGAGGNGFWQVYIKDMNGGSPRLASVNSAGLLADNDCLTPRISGNGNWVVFQCRGSNLIPSTSDQVYAFNAAEGQLHLLSADSCWQCPGNAEWPDISADGRYVVFSSSHGGWVAGDTNGVYDQFVRDRLNAELTRVSLTSLNQQSAGDSRASRVSSDGRFVVYHSLDSVTPNDTNSFSDIVLRDLWMYSQWPCCVPNNYCTAGTSSNGCVPTMSASGSPSNWSGSGFTIAALGVEGSRIGYLYYGVTGASASPWGMSSSVMCVQAPRQRMGNVHSGGTAGQCNGVVAADWNSYISSQPSALGQPFAPGTQVWAQAWYRDPPSPKTTNLSDGIFFVVCP